MEVLRTTDSTPKTSDPARLEPEEKRKNVLELSVKAVLTRDEAFSETLLSLRPGPSFAYSATWFMKPAMSIRGLLLIALRNSEDSLSSTGSLWRDQMIFELLDYIGTP